MNSTIKGNVLEDEFYQYLLLQQEQGELVFGLYPATSCKIYRKKSYYCSERGADVEFDIVIEFFREGRPHPHSYVVFECKNYNGTIPELYVNDFSSKLTRLFRHAAKGVVVVSSRLQSGAESVARYSKMGIVKFDNNGLEIIADRRGSSFIEKSLIEQQIFRSENPTRSLKFSAYHDGGFYGTLCEFLKSFYPETLVTGFVAGSGHLSVPYIPVDQVKNLVREVLNRVGYSQGPVDLEDICRSLSIELQYSNQDNRDLDGTQILGSANFNRRTIMINAHGNRNRERFTLGHEIGHFCLNHGAYLASESIIENDLLINADNATGFNHERLEFQANLFSSNLILPDDIFRQKTAEFRQLLGITDRGHGYIFVDDQPCNYTVYEQLLTSLLSYFEVSKQAIQIKFRSFGMLTDLRRSNQPESSSVTGIIQAFRGLGQWP
ncbi:ImmA/IrrE family metallo-endopeptidase [Rhizobium johnstonii]|uniref:ImmA/IrrE family metallo-endopeptidase n=1 Tax=Rhizobium johnstonii TaxID=3019933 RepID=UPI003F96A6D1